MTPNRSARIPRRTCCCATDQALHTTMTSLRTNYSRTMLSNVSCHCQKLTTIFPEMVATFETIRALINYGCFTPTCMQCFKCRLTHSKNLLVPMSKIHLEYTSQLIMQNIVEKMKKSRTAANRTCRPLEAGSPLRLFDVVTTYGESWIKLTALWIRWQLWVSKNILQNLNAAED